MINCSIYFFAKTDKGYSQYPNDFLSVEFKKYGENLYAESQLVVNKKEHLMYYTYLRQLPGNGNNSFFGISVVINSLATYNIKSMFKLFEVEVQEMVVDGDILDFDENGKLQVVVTDLGEHGNELDIVAKDIKEKVEDGSSSFVSMPPINYSIDPDSYKIVDLSEGSGVFQEYLSAYNTIIFPKNSGVNSTNFNGVSVKIQKLNEEIRLRDEKIEELEKKLREQNGHSSGWITYVLIAFLFVAIVAFVCIIF